MADDEFRQAIRDVTITEVSPRAPIDEAELVEFLWRPIWDSGASMSTEDRSVRESGYQCWDESLRRGVPTAEDYLAEIAETRASGVLPVARTFGFHPDDRHLYAPLIAAAEDDARRHGDVRIHVAEDERYERVVGHNDV